MEKKSKLKRLLLKARKELDQDSLSYISVSDRGRYFSFSEENCDFDESDEDSANLWKVIYPDDETIKHQGEYDSLESAQENNHDFLIPLYNEIYPTDIQDDEAQNAANRLYEGDCSLTLVEISSKYHLALLGAGMDMSWYIVHAYMTIGYYPPAYFSLPHFAGTKLTLSNVKIIEALRRSQEFLQKLYGRKALSTEQMFDWLKLENG